MSGREIIAAIKQAADMTWSTPIACGALDGILLLKEGVSPSWAYEKDEALQAWPLQGDLGEERHEGDWEANLRYEGLGTLIALAMGAAAAPAQQESTAAYLHALTLLTDTDGYFGTGAIDKGHSVWEYPSVKVAGFTIKGQAGKPLEIAFHLICDQLNLNTTTGTNKLSTMATVTMRDAANRVLFRQGVFRVNAAGGDALDADDKVYPNAFEFSFKRQLGMDFVAGSDIVQEPLDDGFPECSLKLDFPKYTADTYLADWEAETYKKADITFTGATISGAYSYYIEFEFPNLKIIDSGAPVEGPGKIVHPVEFDCLGRSAAPTGMADLTVPFRCNIMNKRTTRMVLPNS